ncbi:MAG: prohibitin family protein [Saprospiraceae bacterium]|jgi:prohibitin 1|nr:prohibitin family protein [Saprospiraceae bacterium]MDA9181808.1 prohibitin family protein [Saprospiraceae bacterium]MDA9358641.1 prohibitin family protein [Saprospiraceae bacterium]HAV29848.1 peptidase [Saprospirales bacterium]
MANQQQLPPNIIKYGILAFLLIFIFSILSNTTFLTIQPGKKGVEFKRFGGGLDKDNIYDQGFHIIMPWNKVFIYDVRTNEGFETMDVLSKNGLNISVELSYRYSPMPDKIGYLHDEIGTEYVKRILMPEIRSATREVIGQYLPEELYSTKREAIQDEIFQQTADGIGPKHLIIDAVLIRSVKLPAKLEEAIEQKLKEEQLSLQYRYKLDRERQEAERRIIEAQAKADANRILNASLTDKILKDKGIEATLELAKSPNTKTVIIGGAEGGLPLILNN